MRFAGTISVTRLIVGLKGFGKFTGLRCNRFR